MRCSIGDRWNAFGNAARSLPSGRPHTITRRRHTKHGGQICNARGATVRNSARGGPMYLPNADHFRNSQFASTVAASAPTSCLSDRLHRRHIGARRALSRDGAGRAYPGLAAMPTPMPFSAKSLAQLALIPGPPPTIRATSCAEGLVLGFSDRAMFHTRMCVARETSEGRLQRGLRLQSQIPSNSSVQLARSFHWSRPSQWRLYRSNGSRPPCNLASPI